MIPKKQKGLYPKYLVSRMDRKSMPEGCIVLEWKDPNARKGISAFADAVREDGYEALANDLKDRLSKYEERK